MDYKNRIAIFAVGSQSLFKCSVMGRVGKSQEANWENYFQVYPEGIEPSAQRQRDESAAAHQ